MKYSILTFAFLILSIAYGYAQYASQTNYQPYPFAITPVADSEIHLNQDDGGKVPYDYYAALNCPVEQTVDTVFYAEGDSILLTVESTYPCYVIIYNNYGLSNFGYKVINVDSYSNKKYRKTVTLHYAFWEPWGLNRIIATRGAYVFKKETESAVWHPFSTNETSNNIEMHAAASSSAPNCNITIFNYDTNETDTISGNLGDNVYYLYGHIMSGFLGYTYSNAVLPQEDYCVFTANSSNDVEMFLLGKNDNIVGHCNDFTGQSGHDWGTESRINVSANDTLKAIILLPHKNYLSQGYDWWHYGNSVFQNDNGSGTSDLYIGCKYPASIAYSQFPNLLPNDAIITDPVRDSAGEYNCHSWTVYPTHHNFFRQPYLTGSHDATSIAYYLCKYHGFTETGATEENSDVDIWEHLGKATHTSVRSYGGGAGGNSYGYAWESKLGHDARIMHPRYALTNDDTSNAAAYGHVVKYLIKNPDYVQNDYVFENVEFTEDELKEINSLSVNATKKNKEFFTERYATIKETIKSNYISNLSILSGFDKNYQELAIECGKDLNMLGLLLEKLSKGDALAALLFIDATKESYEDAANEVISYEKNNTNNNEGISIIRTDISEATLYAKKVLASLFSTEKQMQKEGISYSDDAGMMTISASHQTIQISFHLNETSRVSIIVENLTKMLYNSIVAEQVIAQGEHSYSLFAKDKGIYAIMLEINGKIYRKKIRIN